MNFGRYFVASGAVVALATGAGFVNEVFLTESIESWSGYTACMTSETQDEALFGVARFSNEGTQDIRLRAMTADTVEGVEIVGIRVIPAEVLEKRGGVGILGLHDVSQSGWIPVEGALVRPGEDVSIIAHLKATSPTGRVTDFRLDYAGNYGIGHTAHFGNSVGFTSDDPDDEVLCGA